MLKGDGVIQRVKQVMARGNGQLGRPAQYVRIISRGKAHCREHLDVANCRIWREASSHLRITLASSTTITGERLARAPLSWRNSRSRLIWNRRSRTARRINSATMERLFSPPKALSNAAFKSSGTLKLASTNPLASGGTAAEPRQNCGFLH
jgi:hypothetical protein